MSTRPTSRLESLSNIAVIVAAVALVAVLVRHEWPGSSAPGALVNPQGAKIDLAAIKAAPTGRNLVLFISETCQFCEQEMPFYRTLRERLPAQVSLVAVFPPQEPEPEKFLASKAVKVDRVTSSSALEAIGVRGTPTLLLIDEQGRVEHAWIGALPADKHQEVLDSVRTL